VRLPSTCSLLGKVACDACGANRGVQILQALLHVYELHRRLCRVEITKMKKFEMFARARSALYDPMVHVPYVVRDRDTLCPVDLRAEPLRVFEECVEIGRNGCVPSVWGTVSPLTQLQSAQQGMRLSGVIATSRVSA